MKWRKKKPGAPDGQRSPEYTGSAAVLGIGEEGQTEEQRVGTEERRRLFARNLDRLIALVGMTRREVADQAGIAHKLVLRLVSSGVSKTDPRNVESLRRIAAFFALPGVSDFWRSDLLRRLLSTDEKGGFIAKFRNRLLAERERRLAEERAASQEELVLLSRALGLEAPAPALHGPLAQKVAAILASPRAEQFRLLVNDYHELAVARRSAVGQNAGRVKRRGSTSQ
jgi:transcriptional regulator with XRE-family HTH domain